MGKQLRMLILTDYIKKENLSKVASNEKLNSINIVSIFETLRRANLNVSIGVLSGTLVILPKTIDLSNIQHKKEDIANTNYCIVAFSGSTHLVSITSENYLSKVKYKFLLELNRYLAKDGIPLALTP